MSSQAPQLTPIPRRPLIATLDTCVLYPSYLRDFLLSTAYDGRLYAPRWSAVILDELVKNLIEDGGMARERARNLVDTMRAAFPLAEVPVFGSLIPCLTNQIKDRHVVEAALVARSEVIVTNNLKDFRTEDLAPLGLASQGADEFLLDIFRGRRKALPWVLKAQQNRYTRNPLTITDLIAILGRSIPQTVALLRT